MYEYTIVFLKAVTTAIYLIELLGVCFKGK